MKAIFATRVEPDYDDLPESRYHFPKIYLRAAERAVGDLIVYYEPSRISSNQRGGRQSYFAVARVDRIEADPQKPGHYYARISEYLNFDTPVPFREGDHFYEGALKRDDGGTNMGVVRRAVRNMEEHEFQAIIQAGFTTVIEQQSAAMHQNAPGFEEEQALFERPVIERLVARKFRDAAFARHVKAAYGNTCAVTGLKLINGGGRAEVQAAHIRPVASDGPDSTRNGLALSGTVHWMFDRGLISIDDQHRILAAKNKIPKQAEGLIRPGEKILLPASPSERPHRQFLEFHRETVFKG